MANITAAQVKELRERTGAGMMDCKKTLVEANGDLERAAELLRERGIVKARGKAGRTTSEGRVAVGVTPDGRSAALVEVNCETDFVAKTPDFAALCDELVAAAREVEEGDVEVLLARPLGGATVGERLVQAIAKLGENIQVRRFTRLEAGEGGRIETYIHPGGRIGSLVQVEADDASRSEVAALAHNLCMHVAATNPMGVGRDDVPEAEVEHERTTLRAQALQEGKPEKIVERMVEGRLRKFFQEVVLLEQPLVMDPDQTVEAAAKKVGARVVAFRRFELGEELGA